VKKILLVLGFSLIGVIAPVYANLPEKVRDNLSDIIKDYCHSSIEYSIEDRMGTWDADNKKWTEEEGGKAYEFHKTLGCILDSALQELTEEEKRIVENAFGSGRAVTPPIKTFSIGEDCDSIRLKLRQQKQGTNGFESKCKSKIREISRSYSTCKVAETVLQEWCGYDMFLYTKQQDEESFFDRYPLAATYNEGVASFRNEQNRIEEERARVERTVFAVIDWYQQTEAAVTHDSWLVVIKQQLMEINKQWVMMRLALGTFVDKFLNASVPPQ